MALFGSSKKDKFTPLNPPAEVVRQLEEIDKANRRAAQMVGVPRGGSVSGGAIPSMAQEYERLRSMAEQSQQTNVRPGDRELALAMRDQIRAIDALSHNILHLSHLLETLQLSVIGRN